MKKEIKVGNKYQHDFEKFKVLRLWSYQQGEEEVKMATVQYLNGKVYKYKLNITGTQFLFSTKLEDL